MELARLLVEKKGYIEVPLNRFESGHLWLDGAVNGVQGKFILDTGAGSTVIDTKSADDFKMTLGETEEKASGAGAGDIGMQVAAGTQLNLSDLQVDDLEVWIMDLSHVNQALEEKCNSKVDGVIGADILEGYKAVIDYSGMIMYLKATK